MGPCISLHHPISIWQVSGQSPLLLWHKVIFQSNLLTKFKSIQGLQCEEESTVHGGLWGWCDGD